MLLVLFDSDTADPLATRLGMLLLILIPAQCLRTFFFVDDPWPLHERHLTETLLPGGVPQGVEDVVGLRHQRDLGVARGRDGGGDGGARQQPRQEEGRPRLTTIQAATAPRQQEGELPGDQLVGGVVLAVCCFRTRLMLVAGLSVDEDLLRRRRSSGLEGRDRDRDRDRFPVLAVLAG